MGETLPRAHRLRRRSEIVRAQERGERFASGELVLMLLPNPSGLRRLGVTVSGKVGNSVVRSKVKRRFREIFRRRRALLPARCDAVLIARAAAAQASYEQLCKSFEAAAAQARRRMKAPGSSEGRP